MAVVCAGRTIQSQNDVSKVYLTVGRRWRCTPPASTGTCRRRSNSNILAYPYTAFVLSTTAERLGHIINRRQALGAYPTSIDEDLELLRDEEATPAGSPTRAAIQVRETGECLTSECVARLQGHDVVACSLGRLRRVLPASCKALMAVARSQSCFVHGLCRQRGNLRCVMCAAGLAMQPEMVISGRLDMAVCAAGAVGGEGGAGLGAAVFRGPSAAAEQPRVLPGVPLDQHFACAAATVVGASSCVVINCLSCPPQDRRLKQLGLIDKESGQSTWDGFFEDGMA